MLSDKDMYNRMKKGWRGGIGDGTVCGAGSMMVHSKNAIEWLPKICEKYDIKSVCDAGAGDLHWIGKVDWDVEYKAFDLIPRVDGVVKMDVTTDNLPECDMVLCRMVLNHLVGESGDWTRAFMAVERFSMVAKYLVATNFRKGEDKNREFVRLNLIDHLGEPLETIPDGRDKNCELSLWKI